MILANVDDAEVIEVADAWAAKDKINQDEIHIILYSWEISDSEGLNLFLKHREQLAGKYPALVLLTSQNQEKHIKKNLEKDTEYIIIPCSSEELAVRINRLCNPLTLRSNKRYSLDSSTVILQQKNFQFPGVLINISSGGLLCEFDFNESYTWIQPLNIQAKISLGNKIITITDLYSRLVRLLVSEINPDFTPKKLRTAFEFIQTPSKENKNLLADVFAWAESREKLLDNK
jgi:hypothetical protein